jgi:oligoendopeptidase F
VTDTAHTQIRWDLTDLYSGIDDPAIDTALVDLVQRAKKFELTYKGRLIEPNLTTDILLAAIIEYEAIENESSKPAVFAQLLFSTDTSDAARGAFMQKIREKGTELSLHLLFFGLELAAASADIIDPLIESSELANYKHYLQDLRKYSDHMLTEPEERLLEETANTGARAFQRLFSETTSNTVFHLDGEELTQSQVLSRLYSPDREVRKAAAAALSAGLQTSLRTIVLVFNTLLQDKNVKDRLRKYQYAEHSRHLSNELSKETVDLVVDTVKQNYSLVSRYYKVKREVLGVDTLTHYDRYAPLFASEETVDYADAKSIVLDSFGELSPEMRSRAQEFFDKNWIDATPSKGKEGGAYCVYVTPDLHPYVFMNYLGKMKDVMTLAHELGHGVHASLSRAQTTLNFHGTLPLAELASTFGEMLVFEKVVAGASLKEQLALYAEKIEGAFATISRQTALYRFEQAIHTHRRTKGELSAEDFGNYWQTEVQLMFGDSVELGEEHKLWWSYIGHFVRSPFYVYAYSFGELLVMSLFQQYKKSGPIFAEEYLNMLKCGGSLTPQELMAQVDVDLEDPKFWQGGFDALEVLVAKFEALWTEYKSA